MKSKLMLILPMIGALLLACSEKEPAGDNGGNGGPKPDVQRVGTFSFAPNQTAGSPWYQPGGSPINGHVDESFGQGEVWPELRRNLQQTGGSFGIFAAEVGFMSTQTGLIPLLKADGIPISVELPGMTQPILGTDLANAELNGKLVDGRNIFSSIFQITNPSDRPNPDQRGWFFTADRQHWIPDEILFDERQPNLCPEFDADKLASTKGTWQERKDAARKNNFNPTYRLPFNDLLERLRQDYVDYLTVMKAKWGEKMPAIGFHWNVVAGWEWRDENGIDAVHAKDPNYFNVADNFWRMALQRPSYNSIGYCNDLVDKLTASGFKPDIVLFDVDWIYSTAYVKHVLLEHKKAMKERGIRMGINIVEASPSLADDQELYFDGNTLKIKTVPGGNPNECYERTIVAIMQFLKGSGIYEEGMQIRVTSWRPRPYEIGPEVNEATSGSLAHAANAVFGMM